MTDVESRLGSLGEVCGHERFSRMWQLVKQGEVIVADLRRIRRNGPGRLRRAALEVLVQIVGEAGLHPADLAAAERLIRIKSPVEPDLAVSLCWNTWICVRGGDQAGIMAALGLTPVRPATFGLAETVVAHAHDEMGDGLVFVTPEMNGWTVVSGDWCDPTDEANGKDVRLLVEGISGRYGEAHAFCIDEYNDYAAWLVARNGHTVRWYNAESPAEAVGRPLPVERRHLDALGFAGSPEELFAKVPDSRKMDEAFADFTSDCTSRTVAADISIDIVWGMRRSDAIVRGTGLLARVPGAPDIAILPGPHRI